MSRIFRDKNKDLINLEAVTSDQVWTKHKNGKPILRKDIEIYGRIDIIGNGWQVKDTNAYFFQETVNLNFDIIDVTFEANDVETIIPVVMSPIDIIPSATSPVHTNSEKDWNRILAILAIIVLCLLLIPILSPIIRLLIDILSLPFKFIGWLFRRNKK